MSGTSLSAACTACRDALAQDPSTKDASTRDSATAAVHAHLENCADCRAWRDELQALDARIAKALAVPVPPLNLPELPESPAQPDARVIGMDTAIDGVTRGRRARSSWFALAASVLVAAALGLYFGGGKPPAPSLAEQVLAHIDHESFSLVVSDNAVGDERLARIVPAGVARFGPDAGLVTYAQSCVINGHTVPHLVVQGEDGPVTILLMPEEKVDGPQQIANDELQGVILPVGDGSIAIVGEHGSDLGQLGDTVKNSVTWRT